MTIAGPLSARRPLSRVDCLTLLATGGHGRIAASMRAVPVILPVTFVMSGNDVVFDPGQAVGVSRAVTNCVIAFETDHVGSDGRAEWDIHVTGVASQDQQQTSAPTFRLSTEILAGWRAET